MLPLDGLVAMKCQQNLATLGFDPDLSGYVRFLTAPVWRSWKQRLPVRVAGAVGNSAYRLGLPSQLFGNSAYRLGLPSQLETAPTG